MSFETKWNRSETIPTNSGDRFAPVYKLTVDNDLELDGETDLYAEIQSHAESVDIKTIIARYQAGDESILNSRHGQYIDLSELPCTFAEMHQKIIDAENEFNSLPIEIRSEYDFDTAKFIADIGSEHWANMFNHIKASGIDDDNKDDKKKEELKDESEL